MGTLAVTAAEARSAAIMMRRGSPRSIQTPAGRLKRSHGSQVAAGSRPSGPRPTSKTRTASSGKTMVVVIEPRTETPSPNQSRWTFRLPARGGATGAVPWIMAVRGSRARRRCRTALGALLGDLPLAPSLQDGHDLLGDGIHLLRGEREPVLGGEGRVVPDGVGVGIGHPLLHALDLAAQLQHFGFAGEG